MEEGIHVSPSRDVLAVAWTVLRIYTRDLLFLYFFKTCCNQYEFTICSFAGGCASSAVTGIYCPRTWLLALGL